jgi:Cu-Zn family superoxide dismutase
MNCRAAAALVLLGPAAILGACRSDPATSAPPSAQPSAVTAKATFVPAASASPGTTAFLYDPTAVKATATAELSMHSNEGTTQVALTVTGFDPHRSYGAHLHTKPCGPDPAAAGGHFEHHPDPSASASGSTNPSYANPQNEVWLDFTTDGAGRATVRAEQRWALTPQHRPYSLVIHAHQTETGAGVAGSAGPRLACLTITY